MTEIKMGTRKIGTETEELKSGAQLKKIKIGQEEIISNTNNQKVPDKPLPLLHLDNQKISILIDRAVEDLSVPRLLKINNKDTEIVFIKSYNSKSKIIEFSYNIKEINKMLGINEIDLSEFFLTFFIQNIRNYVKKEWNAIPENLPILSVNEANVQIPNTIILDIR